MGGMHGAGIGRRNRGVALLFTLSVGVILIILAVSLMAFYSSDAYAQGQQQQAVQAYWNARSGLERYLDSRQVPPQPYDFGPQGRCSVTRKGADVVLEGTSGGQHRTIVLLNGDPGRRIEQP